MDEVILSHLPYPVHVGAPPIMIESLTQWRNNIVKPLMNRELMRIDKNYQQYKNSKELVDRLSLEAKTDNIEQIIRLASTEHELNVENLKQSVTNYFTYEILLRSQINHVPAMGTEYHIYKGKHPFISLIAPNEWNIKEKYIGTFKYNNLDFEIYKK